MHAHKLVSGRFAGSGDDAHFWCYIHIAINRLQKAVLMQDAEGMAFERCRVLQRLLGIGIIPVGATQENTRIGEARDVLAISLYGGPIIMIEVGVCDNHVSDVFWMNAT